MGIHMISDETMRVNSLEKMQKPPSSPYVNLWYLMIQLNAEQLP